MQRVLSDLSIEGSTASVTSSIHTSLNTVSSSSSSDDTSISCDSNITHIDRVIMEIVETERVYVQDLREIIQVCIFIEKVYHNDSDYHQWPLVSYSATVFISLSIRLNNE